jgi:GTP pyrophosphokinase
VTIHRRDCYNVIREGEKERLVEVEWGQADALYAVSVQVEAWNRVGLLRDISTIVAEEKVNIANMSVTEHDDLTTSLYFTIETKGLAQLSRLLAKIEGIRGVASVARVGDEATIRTSPTT